MVVHPALAYQAVAQYLQSVEAPVRSFENRERLQSECCRCLRGLDACEVGRLAKEAWAHGTGPHSPQCPSGDELVGRAAASGIELEIQVEEVERKQASPGGIELWMSIVISFKARYIDSHDGSLPSLCLGSSWTAPIPGPWNLVCISEEAS